MKISLEGIKNHWGVFSAWVNGAEVEYYSPLLKKWVKLSEPQFYPSLLYRITPSEKPTPAPSPVVRYANIFLDGTVECWDTPEHAKEASGGAVRSCVKLIEEKEND